MHILYKTMYKYSFLKIFKKILTNRNGSAIIKAQKRKRKEEKKMKFATIKESTEIINRIKQSGETGFFGQTFSSILPEYIPVREMKRTFIEKGFGEAEATFIVAAMIKAGAKFTL